MPPSAAVYPGPKQLVLKIKVDEPQSSQSICFGCWQHVCQVRQDLCVLFSGKLVVLTGQHAGCLLENTHSQFVLCDQSAHVTQACSAC